MSPIRRQASNTLPRNFIFHYDDGLPRTPEPLPQGINQPSSPPPRQPYRLRRSRAPRQLSSDYFGASISHDVPIPTIEVSDPVMEDEPVLPSASMPLGQVRTRQSPPPRTPSAQIYSSTTIQDDTMKNNDVADTYSQGESISRPSTACSGISDSSASSSVESFPSLGGSFTSPESETFESKTEAKMYQRPTFLTATSASTSQQQSMPTEQKPKTKWTEEMDNHLWLTYMRYLQDPTHTPFKMLPGTAPPLGVCSRVVREAKRTWKNSRAPNARRFAPWHVDSPDTVKPSHSGSTTPTEARPGKPHMVWPRSDSSSRRRLRELCKRKPTLSAHYNRLLSTRSPSPFLTSAGSRSSSIVRDFNPQFHPLQTPSSFGTRDMGISLFASTSSAVNTLNQMTEQSQTPRQQNFSFPPSSGRVGNHHQKSQSLQIQLQTNEVHPSRSILASPFQHNPTKSRIEPQIFGPSLDVPMESIPKLASPVEIIAPIPQHSLRLGKRRGDSLLGNLGMPPNLNDSEKFSVIPGISTRRVRARGFSLGDVSESSRRLSRIFAPTMPIPQPQQQPSLSVNPATSTLMPPFMHGSIRRLGSPFSEKPSRPLFNTFPRNFSQHGLEPTIESQEEKNSSHDVASSSSGPFSLS